jgi:hypothetical protein
MPTVRVTGGALQIEHVGGGGLTPDQGLPAPGAPGHDLPSGGAHPWFPGHLPEPPPAVWPPPTVSHPIQPAPPGTPPGAIWPSPGHPSHPIAGRPEHPSGQPVPPPGGSTLPIAPGIPTPPIESKVYWVVAGIPGVGWRYVAVDPSLVVGGGPATPPGQVAPPIAPTPEPRR